MKEIYKDIYMIEEFITLDEQQYLLDLISRTPESSWNTNYINDIIKRNSENIDVLREKIANRNTFWDDKILNIDDENLINTITKRINDLFDNKYDVNRVIAIQRQQPGSILKVHFDQGDNPDLEKAVVIYLNDDYMGGELFFPEHDFSIKPPARSLLTFPGTENYMHGISDIYPGPIRYVLPSFGFIKNG